MDIHHWLLQTLDMGKQGLMLAGVFALLYAANKLLDRRRAAREAQEDRCLLRKAPATPHGDLTDPKQGAPGRPPRCTTDTECGCAVAPGLRRPQ